MVSAASLLLNRTPASRIDMGRRWAYYVGDFIHIPAGDGGSDAAVDPGGVAGSGT